MFFYTEILETVQKTTTLWLSLSECAVIDYKLCNSIIVIGEIRSPGQFTFKSLIYSIRTCTVFK